MWAYRPNQIQRRPKKRFHPKILKLVFVGVVLSFLVWVSAFFYLRHEVQKLARQERALLLTKEDLQKKVQRLEKGDLSAYEEVARQKYGLIKKHERLIIFKD